MPSCSPLTASRCWRGSSSTAICSHRSSASSRSFQRSVSSAAYYSEHMDPGGAGPVNDPTRMIANMDPITLRNRLLVATGMWREATGEPLPKLAPGDPAQQIQAFELLLVDRLWEAAT